MTHGRERSGPEWTSAITTLSLIVMLTIATAALYWAQVVFIPIAMAVVGTFILSPAVSRLQRLGLHRAPSVLIVMFVSLSLLAVVVLVVAQQLNQLASTLPDHRPTILAKLQQAKLSLFGNGDNRLAALGEDALELIFPDSKSKTSAEPSTTIWGVPIPADRQPQHVIVEPRSTSWLDNLWIVLGPVGTALGTLALTGVLTFFMLLRREDLRNRMIRLIGHGRVTLTTKAVDDAAQRISRYLLAQLALNTAFGVVITIGLMLMGVDYAALWGTIAFLMRYVPYIGTWIGVIPPVLFSFATSDGWSEPLQIFGLFIGLELLCNNIFEPMLYGSSLGISEAAQLVMAAFWAFLWGPIGLILSGPLTVCLLVLGKYVHRLEFLEVLLGDEPALAPRVAFYQRLVARDQDEASNIASRHVKEHSVRSLLDDVIVPALSLAKRDREADLLPEENWTRAISIVNEVIEEVASDATKEESIAETTYSAPLPILVMPARDEADQTAAQMMVETLDSSIWDAEILPLGTLASELADHVRKARPAAVLIVSLPPGGLSHTRYLVSRIRKADAKVKILVGRWGFSEELGVAADSAGIEGVDRWSDSIATSHDQLQEWLPMLREATESTNDLPHTHSANGVARTATLV